MTRLLGLSLLVLGSATFTACATPSCEDICEEGNECEGVEQKDCKESCAVSAKVDEAAGCESEARSLRRCMGGVDVCSVEVAECIGDALEYGSCVGDYCDQDPVPADCLE